MPDTKHSAPPSTTNHSGGIQAFNFGTLAHGAVLIRTRLALAALGLLIIGVITYKGLDLAQLLGAAPTFWVLIVSLLVIVCILISALITERHIAPPTVGDPPPTLPPPTARAIPTLNGKVLVLLTADVPDYAVAVSRLSAEFASDKIVVDSATVIGLYGTDDLLLEFICDVPRAPEVITEIASVLGSPTADANLPRITQWDVLEVAKINNTAIGGFGSGCALCWSRCGRDG